VSEEKKVSNVKRILAALANGPMTAREIAASIGVSAYTAIAADLLGRDRRSAPTGADARALGYEGDPCRECGQFKVRRKGTCLGCECGWTGGCG
jgi:ribonucleoside-diphosphate reductase alpha chain